MTMVNVLGGGVKNDFGELTIEENGMVRKFFVYACGHCSNQVVMHQFRERPRYHCLNCDRWLCEQNQLCHVQCTPLYAMAKDGLDDHGTAGRLVPAIMQGATSMEEAERRGLLEAVPLKISLT